MAHSATLPAMQGFNAVIFGDHTAAGGDTQGRLAVSGDLTVTDSYSVTGCDADPDCVALPQSNGTRDDLVVGGSVSGSANWAQLSGNAVVGGNVDGGVNISFLNGNGLYENVGAAGVKSSFDFDQALADLSTSSAAFAAATVNGSIVSDESWQLVLSGASTGQNVFSVTADQWGGSSKSRFIDIVDGATAVINVYGSSVDISGGTVAVGTAGCLPEIFQSANDCAPTLVADQNVIVNYVDATSVNLTSFGHFGSALALSADLTASGGSINGYSAFSNSDTSNGFEFHNRFSQVEITPDVNVVPLPSSAFLLLAGLAGLGVSGARRKKAT